MSLKKYWIYLTPSDLLVFVAGIIFLVEFQHLIGFVFLFWNIITLIEISKVKK